MPNPTTPLADQAQTRLAVAALFVALVRALRGLDESVPSKVEAELERLFYRLRDYPADTAGATETLRWASELLRDSN
jgi:hypothetical protein